MVIYDGLHYDALAMGGETTRVHLIPTSLFSESWFPRRSSQAVRLFSLEYFYLNM